MKTKSQELSHRSSTKLSSKPKPSQDIFTNTIRGAMLNRLTIPKKASLVFEEALKEAIEEDQSPEQKCMIAEMHCSMLHLYQNWTKIDKIALLISKDMDTVERKAAKHKSYAQKLGSIPLLYYYISEADLEEARFNHAIDIINRGLKLVENHPDRRVLFPLLQVQKAMCLSKLNQQRDALGLITESEKELDKTVGKVHPLAIKAVLAQSKVYEEMAEFDLSLKCLNQALERAKASPLGLNTDQMEKRKLELTNKIKKAK